VIEWKIRALVDEFSKARREAKTTYRIKKKEKIFERSPSSGLSGSVW
jgi:hypothetical protein